MIDTREEDIIRIIEESFIDVPYPGDDNLFESDVYDPDITDFEELLIGRNWKEVLHILESLEEWKLLFYNTMFCVNCDLWG